MNYKVLYRKYRPDNFNSLIGQNHIIEILKNSIRDGRIAHAYLFSGPRGTGKTSTARILAKAINCLNSKDGVACGECSACLSFNGNPDIIEIDAASNNGVEEIRELINNVKIMPTSFKYKVYIIDEVHMLSQSAFNALLLTLEEPPEHVIFILATTNLESVPITIVSRCQRFEFHRITDKDILERLEFVCKNENIKAEVDGLKEIASLADGGLRDALSILDQLSKNDEVISSSLVSREIGSISNKRLQDLIKALDYNNVNEINNIFNELESVNLSYKVFVKKIIYLLSELGAKLLVEPDGWRLRFDDCKKLVMELNDILMKVNISVSPYLVLKMIFLGYVDGVSKVDDINNEHKIEENFENNSSVEVRSNQEKMNEHKNEKMSYQQSVKINHKLIDVRINNVFVEASKEEKNRFIEKWENFVQNLEDVSLRGMLSDTKIAIASSKYIGIEVLIPHLDQELNEKLEFIEELFNKYINSNVKLVFINSERWDKEVKTYSLRRKDGYVYKYMNENDEDEESNLDINSVANIFDINRIEVE